MVAERNGLDARTLEGWLWEAGCKIRGPVVQLGEAEEERAEADRQLKEVLGGLGLEI